MDGLHKEGRAVDHVGDADGGSRRDGFTFCLGVIFPDGIVDGNLHFSLSLAFSRNGKVGSSLAANGLTVNVDVAGLLHLAQELEDIHHKRHQSQSYQDRNEDQHEGRRDRLLQEDRRPSETEDEIDEVAESIKV